jgi:arylsulfatase A-like enzyme
MSRDIVLLTAESLRRDYVDAMEFISASDVLTGTTVAHYTRPSLASILSSNYRAAMQTEIATPSIAEALSEEGYTCIGLTTSPQADETFGFDAGFDYHDNYTNPTGRGTFLQQLAYKIDIAGRTFHRLFPRHKRREDVPRDDEIMPTAIEQFNQADGPRFLWMHFMESHRPYGRGDDAITPRLDRKAKYKTDAITDDEAARIDEAYRDSLARVDDWIETLLEELDAEDPLVGFAGDHGEGLGENGYYFHPPHLMRTDDELVTVPVVFRGVDVDPKDSWVSLLDLAPTLLGAAGLEPPDDWHGVNLLEERRDHAITIAPWADKATVTWRTDEYTLSSRAGDASIRGRSGEASVEEADVSDEMRQQLRDLGYMDAG